MENDTDIEIYLMSTINTLTNLEEVSNTYDDTLDELLSLLKNDKSLFAVLNKSRFLSYYTLILLKNNRSHNKTLEFLNEVFENLVFPDFYLSKKFIFFISDKLYENLYNNYLPNIRFIRNLCTRHPFIISLLHKCGYFCLLNSVIDDETCKLYNQIFKNKKAYCVHKQKKKNKTFSCFYEVQRKQFDSEIIFKENNLFEYKFLPEKEIGSSYLDEIYTELENTCLFNLVSLNILNMDEVLNYKLQRFDFLINNLEIVNMALDKNINFLRLIRFNYVDIEFLKSHKYFKKIIKYLEDKNINLKYEVILNFSILYKEIDLNLLKIFNEKQINFFISIFEFDLIECAICQDEVCENNCTILQILDFLYNLYKNSTKKYFYKTRNLILVYELSKKIEHKFITEYLQDFVSFLRSDKNNISRVLFSFQIKKENIEHINNPNNELGSNEEE